MKIETALDLITEKIDEFGKRVVRNPSGSSPTNIAAGSAAKQHGFASDVTGEKSLDKTQRMVRGIDFKDYVVNSCIWIHNIQRLTCLWSNYASTVWQS